MVIIRFNDIVDVNFQVRQTVEGDSDDHQLDDSFDIIVSKTSKIINTVIAPTLQRHYRHE